MEITHLRLEPTINIENKDLVCTGKLEVKNIKKGSFFYLNEKLNISQLYTMIKGNRVNIGFSEGERPEDFFIHTAKKILIDLPSEVELQIDEILDIYLDYSGELRFDDWGTNYITDQAIELALYACWFPIVSLDNRPTFEVRINSPKDFLWKANGEEMKCDEENLFVFRNTRGSNDVTIIGIHESKAIKEESIFWGWKADYHMYKKVEDDLRRIKQILKEWYGEPETGNLSVALVPREKGGMYVRGSLIVCQSNLDESFFTEKKEWLIHSWAHEISHLWFCYTGTETYNNWLDEAMAEFSSLMVCKELYGEEHVTAYLEKIKTKFEEPLPAIKTIKRSHSDAHTVYYYWGTLVLLDLCDKIGFSQIIKSLKDFSLKSRQKSQIVTEDFIESLNKITGEDWEQYIKEKLEETPTFSVPLTYKQS